MAERRKLLNEVPDLSGLTTDAIDATRMASPLISKPDETSTSLLDEYGLGAGILALGGLLSKARFAPRLAGKGLLALGMHGMRRTGARIGHSVVGGLAGAALMTPAAYLGAKAMENGEKDKKFNAGNFAAIAAPAAANGLLGYGMISNIGQSVSRADKSGYKGMIKNIFPPKRNIRYAKHGFKLAGKAFNKADISKVPAIRSGFNMSRIDRAKGLMGAQWKGKAGGILALGMLGLEAIGPGMYLNKTLKKNKDGNNGRV